MTNLLAFIQDAVNLLPTDVPAPKEQLSELKSLSLDEFLNKLISGSIQLVINLAIAIVVFYIGKFVISKIHRFVALILLRRNVDRSLSTFILSFVRIVLYFILLVIVIGIIGIETSSFLALFASAGVAIGMALSGTLQNFAGGVLILLLKPYKIGDYIEVQGFSGTVTEIQIFHTIICTPDNKSIIIPNGGLSTSSINNFSREDYRRVNWTVAISYGDDVEKARKAIFDMFAADDRVMKKQEPKDEAEQKSGEEKNEVVSYENLDLERAAGMLEDTELPWYKRLFQSKAKIKAKIAERRERNQRRLATLIPTPDRSPAVYVNELADSSVNLTIRAWVKTSDYWSVFYYYNEKFYTDLPKEGGVNFPFPQLDVHVQNIVQSHQ